VKTTWLDPEVNLADRLEWERAWAVIASRYGNAQCRDGMSGEAWQYMGTEVDGVAGRTEHVFRHQALNGGGRVYARVAAAGA
jgi:hypothetical protein